MACYTAGSKHSELVVDVILNTLLVLDVILNTLLVVDLRLNTVLVVDVLLKSRTQSSAVFRN